jgi:hypothetical protein
VIPVAVNPFTPKVESLELTLKNVPCWECGGSGVSYCCTGECAENEEGTADA